MILREFSLAGKIGLVTGAGRGIGKGIALALADAGADIVVVARTAEEIEQTAKEVRQLGRRALAIPADATQAEQVQKMVERVISEWGKIDILVNTVGTGILKPLVPMPEVKGRLAEISPDFYRPMTQGEWQRVLDANLTSNFLCCRAIGPYMIKQRSGKVICISSMLGAKGDPYNIPYTVTKAGIMMFTRSLALEWARYNINVNTIAPGFVHTRFSAHFWDNAEFRERGLTAVPLRRLLEPREVGLLAVYLASEAGNYITGQTILIDGGFTIQ